MSGITYLFTATAVSGEQQKKPLFSTWLTLREERGEDKVDEGRGEEGTREEERPGERRGQQGRGGQQDRKSVV